ncbi:MAG: MFS transporter [Micrococcaceae bacterium]
MRTQTTQKPWLALIPILMSFFMIMVDTTIVNIAIPTLLKHFNTDLTTLMWVNSAYMLAYAVPLLLTGRLGDRFGQDKLFIAGTFLFTVASAWCGFAHSVHELIIARTVQGLGSAMLTPQTMAMVSKIFPPEERGKAMSMWGAVAGVATMFGPIIGGFLVDGPGWEWIFFVNVPFGILALFLCYKYLPSFSGIPTKFDLFGVVLSGIGLFCLVFAIQESHQYNWGTISGPITVWRLIIVGILFLIAFVVQQKYAGENALLPLELFRNRNFDFANIAGFFATFTMVMFSLPFTIYLQGALGMDPRKSALVLLPMSLASGLMAPVVGRLSTKIQPRLISAAGFIIFGLGLLAMIQFIKPEGDLLWISLTSVLAGIGLGGLFSPIANIVTQSSPRHLIGAGSGVFNTVRQLGGVMGGAVVASVLASNTTKYLDAQADAQASKFPEQMRSTIVSSIKSSGGGASEFGSSQKFTPPPGVPADVVTNIKNTVDSIVKTGLSEASSHTLIMLLVPLILGAIACLLMQNLKLGKAPKDESLIPVGE